jgi:flagellar hook assembly protein FlgD
LSVVSSAPNPFRGATTIRFALARDEKARLRIFDLSGRQVRELVLRATEPGMQAVSWDGRDVKGHPLGSGVYFYQITAGEQKVTRKLVLLR